MADLSLASGLICDLFITTFSKTDSFSPCILITYILSACYYLWNEKTGIERTDKLISRLVRISIQSATVPTVCALANLILNIRSPMTPWFGVANMPLAHTYICSFLYTVNTRKETNDGISTVVFFQDMHIPESHPDSEGNGQESGASKCLTQLRCVISPVIVQRFPEINKALEMRKCRSLSILEAGHVSNSEKNVEVANVRGN